MKKLSVAFWGVIFLLIILLAGCGSGGGASTTAPSNTTIDPNTSIPKIANLNASLDSGGGTTALNTAIASIKQGQNVSNAYIATDGTTIAIELSNGAKGYIFTDNKDQATNIPAQKTILNQLAMPVITTSNIISDSHSLSTVTPGNKTAVIYAPLEDEFKTNYAKVKADLQAVGYTVTTYYNTDATLGNLMQALSSNYGIIIIDSHGKATSSNEFYFLTGEDYNANTYKNLLNTYKSGVTSEKELAGWITFATRDPQSNWKFAVSNKLINDYKYNKSIVYVNACSSFENSSMNDAFIKNGASAYIGWTHTIDITMSNSAVVEYFDALTNAGATIMGAYNTVENDAVLKGMGSFHGIRFPSSDINISYLKYNQFSTDDIYITTSYSLSGTIHSGSNTGAPLSGATVSIAGKTATTSPTGTFTIGGIPAGTYTLTVAKAGYITFTNAAFGISTDMANQSFYLLQPINSTFAVTGTIHSASNSGPVLAGATVSFTATGKVPVSVVSDSAGVFTASGLQAGTYVFTVAKSGYAPYVNAAYSVTSNQTGVVKYLTSSVSYSMSGIVHAFDSSGIGLPGATVSLSAAGKSTITDTTDSNGAFLLTGIQAGTYVFSVSRFGWTTFTNPAYSISSNQGATSFYLTAAPPFGVLATNSSTGAAGLSWGYLTVNDAKVRALSECGAGCSAVVGYAQGTCVSFARGPASYAYSVKETHGLATAEAISSCNTVYPGCVEVLWGCN